MPRRSIADLAVPRVGTLVDRIRTPERLTGVPRKVFAELVAGVPADHFRPGDAPLLECYAETIALAREAAEMLRADGVVVEGRPSPWLAVLDRAHRAAVPMAKGLRLAPSTREPLKTVKPGPAGSLPPWVRPTGGSRR